MKAVRIEHRLDVGRVRENNEDAGSRCAPRKFIYIKIYFSILSEISNLLVRTYAQHLGAKLWQTLFGRPQGRVYIHENPKHRSFVRTTKMFGGFVAPT